MFPSLFKTHILSNVLGFLRHAYDSFWHSFGFVQDYLRVKLRHFEDFSDMFETFWNLKDFFQTRKDILCWRLIQIGLVLLETP